MSQQTTSTIMMVRPAHFGFNVETAANNSFQTKNKVLTDEEVRLRARDEFDEFVKKIRKQGIKVLVIEDTDEPVKPDAIFPNNWISFHQDGTIVTYPMYSTNRRTERREDILEKMKKEFEVSSVVHLEKFEEQGVFLEGTGSMIFDRVNKLVYACTSPRTDERLLDLFCEMRGYQKVAFQAVDAEGEDIYHTNVMMALGEDFVVISLETIKDKAQKKMLLDYFKKTKKEVIDISFKQILSYAGNMLQVSNKHGKKFLIMSYQAFQSLSKSQIKRIRKRTNILHSPIEAIETLGGGSARCMMAEVFLEARSV